MSSKENPLLTSPDIGGGTWFAGPEQTEVNQKLARCGWLPPRCRGGLGWALLVLLLCTACTLTIQPPTPGTTLYAPPAPDDTLAGIGPDQPYTAAPCDRTLDPGANIQDAIDAVRDKTAPYVLCLNPGYYIGGMNGDTTFDPNRDFGDTVAEPTAGGDWWNQTDDGPYYGNIVIKNRQNFTLRGLIRDGPRATILGLPNDEIYPPEDAPPVEQHPNDKGILIKIVNGHNIVLENLAIDGFHYPDFPAMSRKVSVLNRLVWLQNTTDSRIVNNIIQNGGGECVRLRTNSHDNEIAYNTIHGCGYYQFKVQPLQRLWKNGEGIYIGVDPYQIRASQINKQAYWGEAWDVGTDGSRNNLIHHNDIYPGAQENLNPPPLNPLRAGVSAVDGYGNECIDIKEDTDDIGRAVTLPGVPKPQLINNVIRDNRCQGQYDEDSGALDARGSNNLFAHNIVTGTVRGAAMRLGGGEPKPFLVEPLLADPVRACTGAIVEERKWQAYNNRIRKNIFAGYYNDTSDFNGRGGYLASDCDDEVLCPAPGQPEFVTRNCTEQKILSVVKTFAVEGAPMETQAAGSGVCGNVVGDEGDGLDAGGWTQQWGKRLYKGELRPVDFARVPEAAVNLPVCQADGLNGADEEAAGPRGCVGAGCGE
ncbi:MAG TPA: right-handed parallel beta-helix repeat-containing protein [Caldilineaceae bacterium]|nr:right-handed parallel beta-helix repeat-containing protein [Caldilineaceae bacterium]